MEGNFDNNEISNNVGEYVDSFRQPERNLAEILSLAVEKNGEDIYTDHKRLKEAMKEYGATDVQAEQVYILTLVDGFGEFLKKKGNIYQIDIDCFIKNAYRKTGMNSTAILEVSAAILSTLGVNSLDVGSSFIKDTFDGPGFVIPMSAYEKELSGLEKHYYENQTDKDEFIDNDVNRLSILAKGGISRAKSLLGYILLTKEKYAQNKEIGLKNLEEAFMEGDLMAPGLLGDYYYFKAEITDWSKAYNYYIHDGAPALNDDQRSRLINILNYRKFNFITLIGSLVLSLAMLLTIIIAPASTMFEPKRLAGGILFGIELLLIGFAYFCFRKKPFDSLSWVPCIIFILWSLYLLIRIIF